MADANTLNCALCASPFPEPAIRRGGRVQLYCGRTCRERAGNSRRATTRQGRTTPNLSTTAKPSGLPSSLEASHTPPSGSRALSDSPSRLEFLMEKAHSRVGVTAWEIAEIARARNISPWAPLAKILAP